MTNQDLVTLLTTLRQHGVIEYSIGDLFIKLGPAPSPTPEPTKTTPAEGSDELLFWSAQ